MACPIHLDHRSLWIDYNIDFWIQKGFELGHLIPKPW